MMMSSKRAASPLAQPTEKRERQTKMAPFRIDNYHIDWSMRTDGEDYHAGGRDYKRMVITGTLKLKGEEDGWEKGENVGFIKATKINMAYLLNYCGADMVFDVFDETSELHEFHSHVMDGKNFLDDVFADLVDGVILVNKVYVHARCRGHQLGLFLIEACIEMFGTAQTLCALKPFPLQYEPTQFRPNPNIPEHYGFDAPPKKNRLASLNGCTAKLAAHYEKIGFSWHFKTKTRGEGGEDKSLPARTEFMTRLSTYRNKLVMF